MAVANWLKRCGCFQTLQNFRPHKEREAFPISRTCLFSVWSVRQPTASSPWSQMYIFTTPAGDPWHELVEDTVSWRSRCSNRIEQLQWRKPRCPILIQTPQKFKVRFPARFLLAVGKCISDYSHSLECFLGEQWALHLVRRIARIVLPTDPTQCSPLTRVQTQNQLGSNCNLSRFGWRTGSQSPTGLGCTLSPACQEESRYNSALVAVNQNIFCVHVNLQCNRGAVKNKGEKLFDNCLFWNKTRGK